ncbi:uncharacterized protein B0I36DRAFT_322490 [Microdochium trichocladiopsis]|uniref:Uncharacterized protein n=1 Tax=Microdochium trichocladiopsis TaxID=1682393 RepID=A0A9P8Y6V6_9PEZI|nr:uncharacterized protein B0I36DRAFT_322490 [Microdochium trichocladiopsis]KAH7030803.1 hypothetical protein B0I36DRAFT_322490 [Microdochium trichocladiopsis]
MLRRHLSLETLRVYNYDFVLDANPEYVLIKSWVPEEQQDILWQHTRYLREQRSHGGRLIMSIDEKEEKRKHHHHMHHHLMPEPEFEWVRKKEKKDRKRSKSPSMLVWMAGGRPA